MVKETELLLRFSLDAYFSRFIGISKIYYKKQFYDLMPHLVYPLNSWENQIWTSGSHIPYLTDLLVITID